MQGSTTILGFDQVYLDQSFLTTDSEWIDLSDIKNTFGYCTNQSLKVISARLSSRRNRGIIFIGSGNYHYVTYLLLAELQLPFTLVLFDYHTDMLPSLCPALLSCGSWVLKALAKLPLLKKVVLIGVRNDLARAIPQQLRKKVTVFDSNYSFGEDTIKKAIIAAIPTSSVYLSIDKDVLAETEAVTNWEQGNMGLAQLLEIIESIALYKKICGIDVCGEYTVPLAERFYRKNRQAAKTNEQANQKILNTILRVA